MHRPILSHVFRRRAALGCVLASVVGLAPTSAFAVAPSASDTPATPATLAERLVALRSEVEVLSSDLSLSRTQAKEDLRRHAEQVRDLEAELRKEELRLARLNDATGRLTAEVGAAEEQASALGPELIESATTLRDYVEHSLPYRRADRLAAIDRLLEEMEHGAVTAAAGAPRLYTLIQDEKRLTEDSERVRETVSIGGERFLVDAVRLGMVTLLFRTDDGRVGRVIRTDAKSGWRVDVLNQENDKENVVALLDAFGKQIRTGWFDIPLALPPRASEGGGTQ